MNKLMIYWAFLALCLLPRLCAAALLSNPGFESGVIGNSTSLPGWQKYNTNAYNLSNPAIARSGTNFLKVYQSFSGSVNYSGVYQDYISGPGAAYSADGWAYTPTNDALAGQNAAWIEVTFRDAAANILALYRSALITTNSIATGAFPKSRWNNLPITNQYNPNTFIVTNTASQLLAPTGTIFLRYQIVFQGDVTNSAGSMYFDDLNLLRASSAPYGDMNITWSDEFDGTAIKTNIWTYDTGAGGWGNNELEYYTSRTNNAFVSNGLLHIVARSESFGGASYTSARIKSQGLFSLKYGRIEWRAQLPYGVGFWPALWLLGTNISTSGIGWPGCGEFDVMENKGTNVFNVQASIHSGSDGTAIYNFTDGAATTNFHSYTLDWTTNAILFYVDGHLYETQMSWGSSTTNAYPFPFNQPFFLLMNMAIGGNYLGNPSPSTINAGTVFPGEMLLDYLRIYKTTDPFRIAIQRTGANILLSWPSNIVCRLQAQTNTPATGLTSNWFPVTTTTNQIQFAPSNTSVFYRLVTP
jgi:beta-glucanase (GH16 family)